MSHPTALFATTHWSVVNAAGADSPAARAALERLCKAYWYPIYAYVRRRGRSVHDAQDLTQAFFLELLEHGYLARADPRKGRFRAFLLVALNHFMTNEWHRARTLKRGGAVTFSAWNQDLAETCYRVDVYANDHPERLFERRWALAVVDHAIAELRREFDDVGRGELFEALKTVLTGERTAEPYATLAERLQLTEAAVKMSAVRLRRRFAELLRVEVAHTVSDATEVEGELRHLLRVLATAP